MIWTTDDISFRIDTSLFNAEVNFHLFMKMNRLHVNNSMGSCQGLDIARAP